MPTRWASHSRDASPSRAKSRLLESKSRSKPTASVPIVVMPCSTSQRVASALRPGYSLQ